MTIHTTTTQPVETINQYVTYKNKDVHAVSESGKFSIEPGRWHLPHPANELVWGDTPVIGRISEYQLVSFEDVLKLNKLGNLKNANNKRNSQRAKYKF